MHHSGGGVVQCWFSVQIKKFSLSLICSNHLQPHVWCVRPISLDMSVQIFFIFWSQNKKLSNNLLPQCGLKSHLQRLVNDYMKKHLYTAWCCHHRTISSGFIFINPESPIHPLIELPASLCLVVVATSHTMMPLPPCAMRGVICSEWCIMHDGTSLLSSLHGGDDPVHMFNSLLSFMN